MNRRFGLSVAILMSGMALGCTNSSSHESTTPAPDSAKAQAPSGESPVYGVTSSAEAGKEATAHIYGAGDTHDKIHGTATFTPAGEGVKVVVDVDGLKPGEHGIHIHEKADLSDPKLMSTGGHFNPADADHHHSGLNDPKRHAGDLGNIKVDENGHGHLDVTTDALMIEGKSGVVGHAIIIHEKEDDLKTQQPPGNAGGRVAGGAIVLATDGEKSQK